MVADLAGVSCAMGFYFYPPAWIVGPPLSGAELDFTRLGEIPYTKTLSTGIAVKISRDGVFLFDFSEWSGSYPETQGLSEFDARAETIVRRLHVLNSYLACLYTALGRHQNYAWPVMALSPADTVRSSTFDQGNIGASGFGLGTMALRHLYRRFSRHTDPAEFARLDAVLIERVLTVEHPTLDVSFDLLNPILEHRAAHALQLGDLHIRSCNSYCAHDYARCLISAWAISEKLIHVRRDRFISDNRQKQIDGVLTPFINADRTNILKSPSSFPASVIVEALSLLNIIPYALYQRLTQARRTRNDWLHDLKPVSRVEAEEAVRAGETMMKLVEDIDLAVPLPAQL